MTSPTRVGGWVKYGFRASGGTVTSIFFCGFIRSPIEGRVCELTVRYLSWIIGTNSISLRAWVNFRYLPSCRANCDFTIVKTTTKNSAFIRLSLPSSTHTLAQQWVDSFFATKDPYCRSAPSLLHLIFAIYLRNPQS